MGYFDAFGTWHDETAKVPSILNGADVFFFGDSNVFYSAGNILSDTGSVYAELAKEFDISSWHNMGTPGHCATHGRTKFTEWATDENVEKYNKKSTILLFGYGTNDNLSLFQAEFDADYPDALNSTTAVHGISQLIEQKFPKVSYHWIIPPATDWSKWTGSTEPDTRNMSEKMPYIIQRLEEVQFPYCDMYHTSGITSEMLSDGIHLGGGSYDYTTDAVYKYYRRLREYLMNK